MRYSFVIIPVNYSLAGVNLFVGATGITSLYRAYEYVIPFWSTGFERRTNRKRSWRQKTPEEQLKIEAEYAAKLAQEEAAKKLATR